MLSGLALLAVLLSAVGLMARAAMAQPGSGADDWSTPTNLSQSGAAVSPALVVAPDGVYHLFWQDTLAGYVYTSGDGASWAPPQPVDVPFSEPPFITPGTFGFARLHEPRLVADGTGRLHAFWVNFNGGLSYSRVLTGSVAGGQAAWTTPQQVGQAALAPAVAVDDSGRIHLAYIRPADDGGVPAGIYYRRSDDGGETWRDAVAVYTSAYLRVLTSAEARLETAVSGDDVLLAWDEPLLDTVFVARSGDGGASWAAPQVVDQREGNDDAGLAGPGGVSLMADRGTVHLTWRAGTDQGCERYHQWSVNGGETWQPAAAVLTSSGGCPARSWAFAADGGLVYLLTDVQGVANLQAWDGDTWSTALPQPTLSRVTNPATYRDVTLGCWLPVRSADNVLRVFSCGSGAASDIWVQERPLGTAADWFALDEAATWTEPQALVTTAEELRAPVITADADGVYHAFWVGTLADVTQPQTVIYYAHYRDGRWSRIAPLFTETADQLVARVSQGRLLLVWRNQDNGGLFFSQVPVDRAAFPLDWTPAVQIAPTQTLQSAPDLAVAADGRVYIAYSVPLNEGRGVYLVSSADGGVTWETPTQVFDAAAAGWAAVDAARLEIADDQLSMMWTQYTLPENVPHGLYFASSADGGQSWSAPTRVIEGQAIWSDLLALRNGTLLRVWRQPQTDGIRLWYQTSVGGQQWSRASLIPDVNDLEGPTRLTLSAAGQPHLFQIFSSVSGATTLLVWRWENNSWLAAPDLVLPETADPDTPLAAAFAPDGQAMVLVLGSQQNDVTLAMEHELLYTYRAFEAVDTAVMLTPVPTFTPLPVTPTPAVTATLIAPVEVPTTVPLLSEATPVQSLRIGPIDTGTSNGALLIGIIPAGLIVAGVFLLGTRIIRIKRR
ncbi:MAG: exo-alpha-sialidase [Anaerolineales bacterium]|nr:exo-alpha-sialidase [Anaerolineales bacterium]